MISKERNDDIQSMCRIISVFGGGHPNLSDTPGKLTGYVRGSPFLCTGFSILSRKAFGWVGVGTKCPKEL